MNATFVDPGQLQEAQLYLSGVIGPFFADRASKKSREWAQGLANTLSESDTSPTSPAAGLGAEMTMMNMNDDGDGDGPEMFSITMEDAGDTPLASMHSEMGLPVGMGGDLGGLGTEAMDAT